MIENSFIGLYGFSYLLVGVSALFLGFFVSLKDFSDPIKQAFARYSLFVAWWSLFSVPMILAADAHWCLVWDRICLAGLVFVPVGFIHFNFIFLELDKKYQGFIRFNYFLSLLFFFANLTPYFVAGAGPRPEMRYFTDPGILYNFFVAYFVLTSILGIATFFLAYRSATGNRRRQLFNLFWSSFLGYSLGGLNYSLTYRLGSPFLAVLGNLGIFAHELVYAYTITKQRLMDISVVVSRTMAEILTVLSLSSIYVGMVWLYLNYVGSSIGLFFVSFTVIYGVLVGHEHQRVRQFFQTTSDQIFLRGKYDYYRALSEASVRTREKLSLPALLDILYKTFINVVGISNPRIFLPEYFTEPEKRSKRYVIYDKDTHLPVADGEVILNDDSLLRQLMFIRGPVLNPYSTDRELIVPCLLEDRLIGIFVFGGKISQEAFTDEDVRLLDILAGQAALALDHTRSYEKIRAELELAERQLARSQRLASLGTLTAGVTHEIRNPLTVIRTETERLANKSRDMEYLKHYQELVLRHVDRITGIVQRMLGMAKEKPKQHLDVDLNEVVNASLQLIPISRIVLEKDLNKIPTVKGDPEELEEIFVNLIQNAVQAMPDGGRLTLKTYYMDGRIVAEVSDTGKGIPEESRERIFDPFFSTRHDGVGLGLSIVYRIVREYGGDIKVISREGQGTTFKVFF